MHTLGRLEKPVIPAKAGIQPVDFTGSPPSRGRRKEGFSMPPLIEQQRYKLRTLAGSYGLRSISREAVHV